MTPVRRAGWLPRPRLRVRVLVVAALVALVAPAGASAHTRRPAVALDYRLRVDKRPFPHVRAEVLDADRELRLTVLSTRLLVLGLIGEPMLRFDRNGVWVNDSSPTAQTDRLARAGQRGWRKLDSGHSFAWHDHRLAPPQLRVGQTAAWSLPVEVDGRPEAIHGIFVRVRRPSLWPWLVAVALATGVVVAVGRRVRTKAVAFAGTGALAALGLTVGFTTGDPLSGVEQWFELGCTAALAVVAAVALRLRDPSVRTWSAAAVGAVTVAFALPAVGVFWHGVIVSSLPAVVVRGLVAVALVEGLAAVAFGIAGDEDAERRRSSKRRVLMGKGA